MVLRKHNRRTAFDGPVIDRYGVLSGGGGGGAEA